MTTAYTPEAQTCDGTVGTPEPQECGFTQPSIEVEPPMALSEFEQVLVYDSESFFHAPVLVVVSPPAEEEWEVPFMFAGVFDPMGGGGEESQRTEEAVQIDNSANERNLTIGAGGPIGPH